MFMPYFVSFVILKVIVYNLFEYDYGVINTFVTALGGERIDFYNTPSYWPFLITFFHIWKGIGYGMVVYLATIMGIDAELYDAAKVDGANVFQQIRFITLPQLKPTFIILLLYALGGIMKGQFELFYQMVGNNGLLFNVTDILDTYVYRFAMTQPLSIGLGTAAGLYQSVFGFILIMVTNWVVKRRNDEYALF
jgi:ABC-type polysaccharide transport system permease subunit